MAIAASPPLQPDTSSFLLYAGDTPTNLSCPLLLLGPFAGWIHLSESVEVVQDQSANRRMGAPCSPRISSPLLFKFFWNARSKAFTSPPCLPSNTFYESQETPAMSRTGEMLTKHPNTQVLQTPVVVDILRVLRDPL
ncbi:hypothetical protein CRENBAI_004394 [Crenichthys baileyi]|uniref:Uncharacterized protein n=1 Tax=Crenichthys baileyi TaxID=28760 RepID=A0AAV9RVA1_9TELE